MSVELATAYVSLTVSEQGLRKDVNKALGVAVDDTGKKQGSRLGGLLWGGVKKTGVAAAGGIAAATGAALYKGFGRLSGIENAESKLRGLGHSAKSVEGIMENALASVKGTAYGLEEAATTAAGAVAAGVKPGGDLERTLKLTADTATIAGASMGEMGAIFNKVATSNRVSMEEVNQLGDRGIPIMQMLADQYGVTAEEARKMVSSGEVDFNAFRDAIESNISGAALESGNTTQGAFKNMGAALGRVGASLLGGIFPKLKGGFGGVTEMLDNLGPTAEKVGEAIGSAIQWASDKVGNFVDEFKAGEGAGGQFRDTMTRVKDALLTAFDYVKNTAIPALQSLWSWVKDNKDTLLLLGAAVLGGVAAFKAFMFIRTVIAAVKAARVAMIAFNAAMKANPIGIVITAIGALVGGLIYLYNTNETARAIMDKAWSMIKKAISATVDWVMNTAWPWMKSAFQWIGDKANWLWKNVITPAWDGISGAIRSAVDWIKNKAWPWVRDAFQEIGDKATWLWKNVVTPAWEGIQSAISGAWDGAKNIFDKFKSGLSSLRDRFRSIRDGIVNIWGSIARAIGRPVNSAIGFFNDFLSRLENAINKIPGVDISLPRIPEIPLPPVHRASAGGRGGGAGGPVFAAAGGLIPGHSPSPTADNIPAMLTAGEFVLPVRATERLRRLLGAGGLEMLRRGLPGFASGGMVGGKRGGGLGDIWGAIKDAGSFLKDIFTDPIGTIKRIGSNLLSAVGDSWPAQVLTGVGKDMIGKLATWIKEKVFGSDVPTGDVAPGGMPWQQIWSIISGLIPGSVMTSNYRPGAITASGYRSYHGLGRAVDFVSPNMAAAWQILRMTGIPWSELYYTPMGFIRRGRLVPRSQVAPVTQRNHYDHVHAAYAKGGMVKPLLFDRGGYLPKGTSLVHNGTGAPEPLARADQLRGPQRITGELSLTGDGRAFVVGAIQRAPREVAKVSRRGEADFGSPGRWALQPRLGRG